jgi:hypothetical protein
MVGPGSDQKLRAMLFVLSAVAGIAALVLVVAPSWPLSFAPGSAAPPNTAFEVAIVRAFGITILVLAYLLYVAARDPVRYAAVIDGFIFFLVAIAILNVYLAVSQQLVAYYPSVYLIVRAAIQLILAIALYLLKPKRIPRAA